MCENHTRNTARDVPNVITGKIECTRGESHGHIAPSDECRHVEYTTICSIRGPELLEAKNLGQPKVVWVHTVVEREL